MNRLRGRGLIAGLGSTLATNAFLILAGVVTGVCTARALGPTLRGSLLAVTIATSTASLFALLGLDEAIIYYAAGSPASGLRLLFRLRRDVWLRLCGTALTISIFDFLILSRSPVGVVSAAVSSVEMAGVVLLGGVTAAILAITRLEMRVAAWNIVRACPGLLNLALVCGLFAASSLSVGSAVTALFFSNVATTVLAAATQRRHIKTGWATKFLAGAASSDADAKTPSDAIRYGRRLASSYVPQLLSQRLDQLALSVIGANTFLGIYGVAASLLAISYGLATALEQLLFPRFRTMSGHLARSIRSWLLGVGAVGAVGCGAAYLLAPLAIRLVYGAEYAPAVHPLRIMLGAAFLAPLCAVLSAGLKSLRSLDTLVVAQSAALGAAAASITVGVALSGAQGVVWGPFFATLVLFLSLAWMGRREFGKRVVESERVVIPTK